MYVGYQFYGQQAAGNILFMVPQMLIVMVGIVWALALTFLYPMMVSYRVTFGQLIKNSLVMAVGRLPQTVGIRLLMLIPTIICIVVFLFTGSLVALLVLALYYVVIGFAMARFVYASYTNGVFDRYINSHIVKLFEKIIISLYCSLLEVIGHSTIGISNSSRCR